MQAYSVACTTLLYAAWPAPNFLFTTGMQLGLHHVPLYYWLAAWPAQLSSLRRHETCITFLHAAWPARLYCTQLGLHYVTACGLACTTLLHAAWPAQLYCLKLDRHHFTACLLFGSHHFTAGMQLGLHHFSAGM